MPAIKVASPPPKPLLIFDGDCGFCRRWVARWQAMTEDRVDYAPSQEVQERFPEIPPEQFDLSVVLVTPSGETYTGAEAVFQSLAHAPGQRAWLWCYHHIRGFRPVTEAFYRFVASHRQPFSALTRLFLPAHAPVHQATRSLFLRGLGLIYLIAFVSLWTQIIPLSGQNGIQPAGEILRSAKEQLGTKAFLAAPTLCWLSASDASLHAQCAAGVLASSILMAGFFPAATLAALWLLYLSLSVAGDVFLGFQWDNLLLETGLLALFFAPMSRTIRSGARPSTIMLFGLRWLLFRLMFESGCVKLLSRDPSWASFTALRFHYETQPLPTMFGWYAHQLPGSVHSATTLLMFVIELVLPFLIFGPRPARIVTAAVFAVFQIGIAATGNYGYFNILSILLCLVLLDDGILAKFSRNSSAEIRPAGTNRWAWPGPIIAAVASVVLLVSAIQLLAMFRVIRTLPQPFLGLYAAVHPFRSINQYGLFAVMTRKRTEIVIEGSTDQRDWRPYVFRYKPQDLERPPRWVAPHQPRLDWQMWFAALGDYQHNPWFINLCMRLLQGQPEVLGLLEKNPFPGVPPQYIRATSYTYHFTDAATRAKTGRWWERDLEGTYCPPLSIRKK